MKDLLSTPVSFPKVQFSTNWNLLSKLPQDFLSIREDGYRFKESINDKVVFSLRRDFVTNQRYTDIDVYSLVGLSKVNTYDTHAYITEGISDFLALKLLLPDKNVLGSTKLGGGTVARQIICSLFDSVTLIADNDNAGQSGITKWTSFLKEFNIKCDIWFPPTGIKDLCDTFVFNYKIDNEDIIF